MCGPVKIKDSSAESAEARRASIRATFSDFARVFLLCWAWFAVSAANGVVGKTILDAFPRPLTLTLCELSAISLLTPVLMAILKVR